MALQPPAVSETDNEAAAAAQGPVSVSAGPGIEQEHTSKAESVPQRDMPNKQEAGTTEHLTAALPAHQPVADNAKPPDGVAAKATDGAAAKATDDAAAKAQDATAAAATVPTGVTAASEGAAQDSSEQQSEEASVPSTVDVVCADTKGVLVLNFKAMRCNILYKGKQYHSHAMTAQYFLFVTLHCLARLLSSYKSVLTRRYHCSQNTVCDFKLPSPYIENGLTSRVPKRLPHQVCSSLQDRK